MRQTKLRGLFDRETTDGSILTVTYKILLRGSDGKDYVSTYDELKQDLGFKYLKHQIDVLFRRINEIETEIYAIYEGEMRGKILDLLRANPDMKTRAINDKSPRERFKSHAFFDAFEKLSAEGMIVPTSHGAGHNRTWRIAGQ